MEREYGTASRAEASHSRPSTEQKATFKGHFASYGESTTEKAVNLDPVAIFLKIT